MEGKERGAASYIVRVRHILGVPPFVFRLRPRRMFWRLRSAWNLPEAVWFGGALRSRPEGCRNGEGKMSRSGTMIRMREHPAALTKFDKAAYASTV